MIHRIDGKRLRVDGKTARSEDCCCEPVPCEHCADATPETLTCDIVGHAISAGCTSCGALQSIDGGAGESIDGTYTLTRTPDTCCWIGTVAIAAYTHYGNNNCTGATLAVPTTFAIILCKVTATDWTFNIVADTVDGTWYLFRVVAAVTETGNCSTDLPTFTSDSDETSCQGPLIDIGEGGVAVITA